MKIDLSEDPWSAECRSIANHAISSNVSKKNETRTIHRGREKSAKC